MVQSQQSQLSAGPLHKDKEDESRECVQKVKAGLKVAEIKPLLNKSILDQDVLASY